MNIKEAINHVKFAIEYSQEMFEGNGDDEDMEEFIENTDEAWELILNKLKKEKLWWLLT